MEAHDGGSEDNEEVPTDPSTSSARPRKTRKKVSRRNRTKRTKQRGTYKGKSNTSIGLGDPDLVDCIFSDDEVKADFLSENVVEVANALDPGAEGRKSIEDEVCSDNSDVMGSSGATTDASIDSRPPSAMSMASNLSSTDTTMSSMCISEAESRPQSAADDRPSSATPAAPTSRPTSVEEDPPAVEISALLGITNQEAEVPSHAIPPLDCIENCLNKFRAVLPKAWIPISDRVGIHLILLSDTTPKAIQREIILHYSGRLSINVHCESIISDRAMSIDPPPPLLCNNEENVQKFCDVGLKVVRILMDYSICVGANHDSTRGVWSSIPGTYIDRNPYREQQYHETCRSIFCVRLVKIGRVGQSPRCAKCTSVFLSLKRREDFLCSTEAHSNTRNMYLTPAQASKKIQQQHEDIRKKDKRIHYLEKKVAAMLDKEGVDIEEDLSAALSDVLSTENLSPVQKLFLEQQLASAGKSNPRSRRWHPTMIRFALFLKDKLTNSGYESIRDCGMINLPSARTLFDYSHSFAPQEGVSDGVLKIVSAKVEGKSKQYQKYHVLLCDEMYVSKNLVYRQGDNALVGYQHLDEVDKELKQFEIYVEEMFTGQTQKSEPELAKTMLAFMIKGMASDVKYVVAAFPMKDLSSDVLYSKSWQVISRLEKAGVKVLVYVCDGAPVNRTFINMHVPISTCDSNIVFDTLNICSPEQRPLFFISDVCHLLKTIRNCLYNSGDGSKKTRCMTINGERLMWKTIIRLYLTYKQDNFRKSYKLNAQNVFPDKFSCMSVKNAAAVLSETVAQDIEDQKWAETKELVKFIRYVNKFFDCLNGAFKLQAIRTRNPNLAPYESPDDDRFDWLGVPYLKRSTPKPPLEEKSFLQYLQDWQVQVKGLGLKAAVSDKLLLAHQTMHGIEMSIRGFAGAVRYLFELEEPPKFILARIVSQDPLEQHFSLQRDGCGGSRNPNVSQFSSKVVNLTVMKDLGVRHRKSNSTETEKRGMAVSEEPLPKRQKKK